MGLITFILLLMLVTPIGVLLGSTVRAYTDPRRALYVRALAGRRRPPGAWFLPRARVGAQPQGRYAIHGMARGLVLRSARDIGAAGAGSFSPAPTRPPYPMPVVP